MTAADTLAGLLSQAAQGARQVLVTFGVVHELRMQRNASGVDWGAVRLRVRFGGAIVQCEWLESFNPVIQQYGAGLLGRTVVVHIVEGKPVVAATLGREAG